MINSVMPSIEVARPCQWVVTYLWYLLKVNVSYWEGSLWRLHDYKRILVSLAVSVKIHNTVFHIFTDLFCTLYMSTASLQTLQMVLKIHIPLSFFFVVFFVSNGLLSDVTFFHLQTESNSLIEHNVSAAWCQWISKCFVFFSCQFP